MSHLRTVIKIILAVPVLALVCMLMLAIAMIRPDIPVSRLIPAYTDRDSRFVDIDGMAVHIRDTGDGPAVLLIHGTFSSLHTWDAWISGLSEQVRVIRLDLPGFGLTGPHPENRYSTRATLHLLDTLRQISGVASWTLAGNSLGGRIALDYGRHFPQHTDGLILIDASYDASSLRTTGEALHTPEGTSVPENRPSERASRPFVMRLADTPVLRNLMHVATPRIFFEFSLEGAYGDKDRISPEIIDRYYDLMRREGNRKAFLNRRQALQPGAEPYPELPEPLPAGQLPFPVLILWGEKDSWIPVSHGKRLQQLIPGSELVVYPEAGHVPMEEIPEKSLSDVSRFLNRLQR